jgi:hypothetical protein
MPPSHSSDRHPRLGKGGRRLRQGLFLLGLALGTVAVHTGCAWKVTPPPTPANPAVAFITDYGRHSRLALQTDENTLVEYTFGDWRYYANDERSLWRGVVALVLPGEAGFGRRQIPFHPEEQGVTRIAGAVRSARIEVEGAKLDALLLQLDERWNRNRETSLFSDLAELHFVKDDASYHLFRNSNHQTAAWLRSLGCEVRGTPILSNFEVEQR